MVTPFLLIILIVVIYGISRLLRRWKKLSKHETLQAVGTILLVYIGASALVVVLPFQWAVKGVLLIAISFATVILSLEYFYRKNDIKWFNNFAKVIIIAILIGMASAIILSPTIGESSLDRQLSVGIAVFFYILVIFLIVLVLSDYYAKRNSSRDIRIPRQSFFLGYLFLIIFIWIVSSPLSAFSMPI